MADEGTLDRKSSLIGAAIGLVFGGVAGFVSGSVKVEPQSPEPRVPVPVVASASPAASAPSALPLGQANPSFAQQGEDLVIQQMLRQFNVKQPTYLDIGAHDPIRNSNTYLFYALGGHGVLVEPNPTYAEKIRRARPRDVVLEVGVGVSGAAEADYYMMGGDGQLNTFSKAQADSLVRVHHHKIEGVVKRKLVPVNQILEAHFKDAAPDVLSIDIEGLDYEILKTLDWNRWRPKVVCVETSHVETGQVEREVLDLLEKNGYVVRGGSFVNTIFLDDTVRAKFVAERDAAEKARDAGAAAKASADAGH